MAMSVPHSFAQLLKSHRLRRRWTQQELSDFSGVGKNTISELERGIILTPHRDTIDLLAGALRLDDEARAAFENAARKDALIGGPGGAAATRALPRDIGSFIGRADELRIVKTSVETGEATGICVIGGMAGIGKTAFAIHVAHQVSGRFPDWQIFLPLRGHVSGQLPVTPEDALENLLLTIGVAASEIPSDLERRAALWRQQVADKELLLVLDDAVSSDQVRPLLPSSRRSLALITSRVRLTALDDVSAIELDALPPEESAKLIVRLVARPGLKSDDPAIGEIAERCGHLPLALAMMARGLHYRRSWTTADLAADLASAQDRLRYLTAENRSVATAFDLSYSDLTVPQRQLFRYLGLHPGADFDEHAIAALAGPPPADQVEIRASLFALCDHYLLTEPVRGRYRFHDLIRDHARALAADDPADERDAALDRLLGYYLDALAATAPLTAIRTPTRKHHSADDQRTSTPDLRTRATALAWLNAERLNLDTLARHAARRGRSDAAIALVTGLHGYLRTQGYWQQSLVLLQMALELAQGSDDLAEADVLTDLSDLRYLTGAYAEAGRNAARATELYRGLGASLGEANALDCLAVTRIALGNYPAAVDALERALNLYQAQGDFLGEANAYCDLASVQFVSGDYAAATASLARALALHHDVGNQNGEANALIQLAGVQYDTGQYSDAAAGLAQALALHRVLGTRNGEANALYYLGAVQVAQQDNAAAIASLEEALGIYRELGSRLGQAGSLAELGRAVGMQNGGVFHASATAYLDEAFSIYLDLKDRYGQAEVLNIRGEVARAAHAPAEALVWHTQALSIATDIAAPLAEALALEGIGHCQVLLGDITAGTVRLRVAHAIYRRIGAPGAERVQEALRAYGQVDES